MRRGSTLPFILLIGGLAGCGAAASRGDVAAAELQAQSRAEALRVGKRLLEMEAQIAELDRRLASQPRACEATPDPLTVDVASARERPKPEPLRSEGDFMAEARVIAPAAERPPATVAVGATTQLAARASEREHLQQVLEGLREYTLDRQGGLSLERREALRVLLRRERRLDSNNPWGGH